jgi:DNA-directed RNA polymerase
VIHVPPHLYDDQRERELECIDKGVARYRETFNQRNLSESPPGMRLIKDAMDVMIPAVDQAQMAVLNGHKIQGITKWGPLMVSLPADRLALITLIHMVNESSSEHKAQYTASRIGASVDQERTFDKIRRECPKEYKKAVKYVREWDIFEAGKFIKRTGYEVPNDRICRLHLGAYLMHLAISVTGIFEKKMFYERKTKKVKTNVHIDLTPEAKAKILESVETFEILQPYDKSMIVPPNDWTDLKNGGFDWIPMDLIKSDYRRRSAIHEVEDVGEMIHTVNALQRTPWRINKRVLEVVEQVIEADSELGNMPKMNDFELPSKPENANQDKTVMSDWLFRRQQIHQKNRKEASKRRNLLTQVMLAQEVKDYEAIWFVWQMDWRGRLYPKATALHPQSDDIGKALLEFAEPTPLGEHGLYWLTIHLANCIGWDKEELDEKIRRVQECQREIELWAEDPLVYKGWSDTDSPYRCLAAAIEYANACKLQDPSEYPSRIPVAMDGTCNGLQHLSALGRDPVGAEATNLSDSKVPSDIYKDVAREVLLRIAKDVQSRDPLIAEAAKAWQPYVNRDVAKRGTMTTPLI